MTGPLLVIGFGGKGVGDQIVATPFIRSLARNFPDSPIDFAASSAMGVELLRHDPHLRETFVLDMDCFRFGGTRRLGEKLAYIASLRHRKYQRIYVLSTKLRHALVAFIAGGRERLGFATYHREFLLTKSWPEPLEKNLVDRFLDLLALDGLVVADNRIDVALRPEELAAAELRLAGLFPDNRPVVALAPFAADMRRTWGVERFAELAHGCAARGWGVVLLGAVGDRSLMNGAFTAASPVIADLVGALTIRETGALISRAKAFVGNDSGLAHLAGAVATPGIVIGYHVTKVWYPSADCIETIIRDPDCRGCDLDACTAGATRTPPCFEAVSVAEVLDRVTTLMEKK